MTVSDKIALTSALAAVSQAIIAAYIEWVVYKLTKIVSTPRPRR